MKKELYKETGYPGIKQRISDNMYIVTIDLGRQLRLNKKTGLMEMKVGLTFACMNLKKLAKIKARWGLLETRKLHKNTILDAIRLIKEIWLWDINPRAALSTV